MVADRCCDFGAEAFAQRLDDVAIGGKRGQLGGGNNFHSMLSGVVTISRRNWLGFHAWVCGQFAARVAGRAPPFALRKPAGNPAGEQAQRRCRRRTATHRGMSMEAKGASRRKGIEGNRNPLPVGDGKGDDDDCDGQADDPAENSPQTSSALFVQPFAQFLAGLEERHALGVTSTAPPVRGLRPVRAFRDFDRKGAEAAQFDPVAILHGADDFVEDLVDDALNVAVIEMGIAVGDLLDEFRLDHDFAPVSPRLSKLRVPKHKQTVKPCAFDLSLEAFKAQRLQHDIGNGEAKAGWIDIDRDWPSSTTSRSFGIFLSDASQCERHLLAAQRRR